MSWAVIAFSFVFAYLFIGTSVALLAVRFGIVDKRNETAFPLFGWPLLLVMAIIVIFMAATIAVYNKFVSIIWYLGGGTEPKKQEEP